MLYTLLQLREKQQTLLLDPYIEILPLPSREASKVYVNNVNKYSMQKAFINSKMQISTFNRYYRYKTVLTASRLITHKAENVNIMTLYLGMY